MIRLATLSDLPRLFELVQMMQATSRYAGMGIDVDVPTAKSILRDGVLRNGGEHIGGTLLNVTEADGKIEGFMLGILQRLYLIGNRLEAQDFWLFCSPQAPKMAPLRLIGRYIEWAANNPKVAEVTLSWTDVTPQSGKIADVYKRLGFVKSGEMFKRATV